jgi:hypothetical protein
MPKADFADLRFARAESFDNSSFSLSTLLFRSSPLLFGVTQNWKMLFDTAEAPNCQRL